MIEWSWSSWPEEDWKIGGIGDWGWSKWMPELMGSIGPKRVPPVSFRLAISVSPEVMRAEEVGDLLVYPQRRTNHVQHLLIQPRPTRQEVWITRNLSRNKTTFVSLVFTMHPFL
jgi:hypothetical protein